MAFSFDLEFAPQDDGDVRGITGIRCLVSRQAVSGTYAAAGDDLKGVIGTTNLISRQAFSRT